MAQRDTSDSLKVRIAVEGCGHGTLDAIYTAVEESCRLKGWNGVDLVIVGGDFQAVRNQRDLNVTAMPQKYRKMADFHDYYSGTKKAPYLTIFIGGNHEASNHLYELYYGGWVAPNIYYLGAANVIRFGPLRIAALSGIWKGYDYRKPHFERLPYNQGEMTSIFHVREIDTRKLLAIRDQVDIGLSHDWPQRVEYSGDFKWLFRTKPGFGVDSERGKLGSVAAKQCLDRLRPAYWFSAHLHTKFTALVKHEHPQKPGRESPVSDSAKADTSSSKTDTSSSKPISTGISSSSEHVANQQQPQTPNLSQARLLAWQNFHIVVRQEDLAERDRILQDHAARKEEELQTGVRKPANYTFAETFKRVETDNDLNRTIMSRNTTTVDSTKMPIPISNLDGANLCHPAKKQKDVHHAAGGKSADPNAIAIDLSDDDVVQDAPRLVKIPAEKQNTVPVPHGGVLSTNAVANNPDQIEIDLSDEDAAPVQARDQKTIANPDAIDVDIESSNDQLDGSQSPMSGIETEKAAIQNDCTSTTPAKDISSAQGPASPSTSSDSDTRGVSLLVNRFEGGPNSEASLHTQASNEIVHASNANGDKLNIKSAKTAKEEQVTSDVSEETRQKLAALSSNFNKAEKSNASPSLPFPEAIFNKTTRFLALGKAEQYQEFLQLLEIEPITTSESPNQSRPFKLHYDPTWLAILRVFAPELTLGGEVDDKVAHHLGEEHYQHRIEEEQKWVESNIAQNHLLQVPENFEITAPVYDVSETVGVWELPREYTNPQTVAYCQLIGIENKFEISEEERDQRMQAGPKPESSNGYARQHGFGNRGGGRNSNHGHGRNSGRGGGANRGRGRGDRGARRW